MSERTDSMGGVIGELAGEAAKEMLEEGLNEMVAEGFFVALPPLYFLRLKRLKKIAEAFGVDVDGKLAENFGGLSEGLERIADNKLIAAGQKTELPKRIKYLIALGILVPNSRSS